MDLNDVMYMFFPLPFLLFFCSTFLFFGSGLIVMAYEGYEYYQAQLEHALNDDFDKDQYIQHMVDASLEMVQELHDDSDGAPF